MNKIPVLAVILALCTPCSAQETSVDKLFAQSDPAIQEQIQRVYDALNQSDVDPRSNVTVFQEMQNLKNSVVDKGEIVKQIAIFTSDPKGDEARPLVAHLILNMLDFPPRIIIRALASHLDSGDENLRSFVRGWFRGHDKSGSGVSPLDPVNYRDYRDYASRKARRNEEVPTAFVEYIFERSPSRALLVFLRADRQSDSIARMMEMNKKQEAEQREREKDGRDAEMKRALRESLKRFEDFHRELRKNGKKTLPLEPLPPSAVGKIVTGKIPDDIPPLRDELHRQRDEKLYKEIMLAEHLVGNAIWLKENKFNERFQQALPEAKEELSKLAEYEQWWVRLYVAEIMRRHRELRQTEILEKLSQDANALVSKSAESIKD